MHKVKWTRIKTVQISKKCHNVFFFLNFIKIQQLKSVCTKSNILDKEDNRIVPRQCNSPP